MMELQREVIDAFANDQVSQQPRSWQPFGNGHLRFGRRDHYRARVQGLTRLRLRPLS
jgi:hypothetical protein